jgi:hypothetical protein
MGGFRELQWCEGAGEKRLSTGWGGMICVKRQKTKEIKIFQGLRGILFLFGTMRTSIPKWEEKRAESRCGFPDF